MRTSLLRLLLCIVCTAPLPATAASLKATINGMVCAFCAQGIEKRLQKLPEIGALHVDLKRKLVLVEAKAGSTLDEKKIAAEIREAGYDVVALETLPIGVDEFRRESRGTK